MQWWRGICLDVDPFAMVNIEYYNETEYHTYEVGDTGVLHMLRDTNVQDMCFFEYQDDIYCLRYHKDEQYLCWRCKDNRSFTYTGDIRVRPVNVKIVATGYVD